MSDSFLQATGVRAADTTLSCASTQSSCCPTCAAFTFAIGWMQLALACEHEHGHENECDLSDEDMDWDDFSPRILEYEERFTCSGKQQKGRKRGKRDQVQRVHKGRNHRGGVAHFRQIERAARISELLAERREKARTWVVLPCLPRTAYMHTSSSSLALSTLISEQQLETFAAAAGVDVATFRFLQTLQTRDIRPADYDLLASASVQANKRTLDASRLSAFPTFVCSADSSDPRLTPGAMCLVCQEPFACGDQLRKLPCECGHTFHSECIDAWLTGSAARCPVDQQELS